MKGTSGSFPNINCLIDNPPKLFIKNLASGIKRSEVISAICDSKRLRYPNRAKVA